MNHPETPNLMPADQSDPLRGHLLDRAGDLAAYLDGVLAPRALDAVEAHLAECAACRESVAVCREALAEADSIEVPAEAIAAARSLILDRLERREQIGEPATLSFEAARLSWPAVRRWSLAAAAAVAVCVTGYLVGGSAVASAAESDAADDLMSEMSFGMFDEEDESIIVELVMAEGGEGT